MAFTIWPIKFYHDQVSTNYVNNKINNSSNKSGDIVFYWNGIKVEGYDRGQTNRGEGGGGASSQMPPQKVDKLVGAQLTGGYAQSVSMSEVGNGIYFMPWPFLEEPDSRPRNNQAGANGQTSQQWEVTVGKGSKLRYQARYLSSYRWDAPNDLVKSEGGMIAYGNTATQNENWSQIEWPKEKYMRSYGATNSVKAGTQVNYNTESSTGSGTYYVTGYYSGIPTYSTTTKANGYTVKNNKMVSTSAVVNTTIIAPDISNCKTKPQNFVVVAGGFHGFQTLEYSVAEFSMREDFLIGHRGRVPFNIFGVTNPITQDDSSVRTAVISHTPIARKTSRIMTVQGQLSITNLVDATRKITLTGISYTTRNGRRSYPYRDYDDEKPTITTKLETYESGYWKTTTASGTCIDLSVTGVVPTTNSYGGTMQTTGSVYPYGYKIAGGTQKFKQTASYSGFNGQTLGETRGGNEQIDHYNTYKTPVGYLAQEYIHDRVGYYFTDPKNRAFDANLVLREEIDANTFRCWDATCIDILNFANRQKFQTASTINNTKVSVTTKMRSPEGSRSTLELKLQETKNFENTGTTYLGINPNFGATLPTIGPCQERATYKQEGKISGSKDLNITIKNSYVPIGVAPASEYLVFGRPHYKGNAL
jgi:hypothetical protein